jgi:hypothetical protein
MRTSDRDDDRHRPTVAAPVAGFTLLAAAACVEGSLSTALAAVGGLVIYGWVGLWAYRVWKAFR